VLESLWLDRVSSLLRPMNPLSDTNPALENLHNSLISSMSEEERFSRTLSLIAGVRALALASISSQYPHASSLDIYREFALRNYGRELCNKLGIVEE
jgi:hypothetical protein